MEKEKTNIFDSFKFKNKNILCEIKVVINNFKKQTVGWKRSL